MIRPPPTLYSLLLTWQLVNRDALFSYDKASEEFLQRVMSLMVASHYKVCFSIIQVITSLFKLWLDYSSYCFVISLTEYTQRPANAVGRSGAPFVLPVGPCRLRQELDDDAESWSVLRNPSGPWGRDFQLVHHAGTFQRPEVVGRPDPVDHRPAVSRPGLSQVIRRQDHPHRHAQRLSRRNFHFLTKFSKYFSLKHFQMHFNQFKV